MRKIFIAALLAGVAVPTEAATLITYTATGVGHVREIGNPIGDRYQEVTIEVSLLDEPPYCDFGTCLIHDTPVDNHWVEANIGVVGGSSTYFRTQFTFAHELNGVLPTDLSELTDAWISGRFVDHGRYTIVNSVQFTDFAITTATVADGDLSGTDIRVTLGNIAGYIPEPSTWAMMIGGFALAGAALRRGSARLEFA